MPRRSRSLSAGSKGTLRPFTALLKHLAPEQKDRLESAFSDAESLLDFHSETVPERLQKRRISGLVKQIGVTIQSSVLGAFVSWSRLDDPKVALYEIQISDDDVFSGPETFTTVDTFFSVEGITTVKFIRVRGVRLDGETGIWSETAVAQPTVSAPEALSFEFYPNYIEGEDPTVQNERIFGGGLDSYGEQSFYTILSTSFYSDRISGGQSIWGYVSNRLRRFTDVGRTPWDRVRFTVNGIHRLDSYFAHWTNAFDIDNANRTDFYVTQSGQKFALSFYSKGGYTAAFGPYGVAIPNLIAGVGPSDARRVTSQDSTTGHFYWDDVFNARYPSRFDQAQLPSFNYSFPAHEANCLAIAAGKKTHWLVFQDFDFSLPEDSTIVGIEAKIKRRQLGEFSRIPPNLGVVRPDKGDGHDLVLEHLATNLATGRANVEDKHVFRDVDFGKYLDLRAGKGDNLLGSESGRLAGDPSGNGEDGVVDTRESRIFTGNKISISLWFNVLSDNVGLIDPVQKLFDIDKTGSTDRILIRVTNDNNNINNYIVDLETSGGGTLSALANAVVFGGNSAPEVQFNTFHHIVATYDPTAGTPTQDGVLKLYVDGSLADTATAGNAAFDKTAFRDIRRRLAIGGDALDTTGEAICGMSEVGVWNSILTENEIIALFNAQAKADYRADFSFYRSSHTLQHYFLHFPETSDIRDSQIILTDRTGFRDDLDNKALTSESWPFLSNFFYTTTRQYGVLPLASSDGIPHDNHLAIGYQTYGGLADLWSGTWTPNIINDFYFGLAIQALNANDDLDQITGSGFIDHAKLTVYTLPRGDTETIVEVSAASANAFYYERELWAGLINLIEAGETPVDF